MGLLFGVLLILLICFPKPDPQAPRFVFGQPKTIGPFKMVHYYWGDIDPFHGGKVWMWTTSPPTNHVFLYNLDTRKILGELFNADPAFLNHDETKLLCGSHGSLSTSIKQRIVLSSKESPLAVCLPSGSIALKPFGFLICVTIPPEGLVRWHKCPAPAAGGNHHLGFVMATTFRAMLRKVRLFSCATWTTIYTAKFKLVNDQKVGGTIKTS